MTDKVKYLCYSGPDKANTQDRAIGAAASFINDSDCEQMKKDGALASNAAICFAVIGDPGDALDAVVEMGRRLKAAHHVEIVPLLANLTPNNVQRIAGRVWAGALILCREALFVFDTIQKRVASRGLPSLFATCFETDDVARNQDLNLDAFRAKLTARGEHQLGQVTFASYRFDMHINYKEGVPPDQQFQTGFSRIKSEAGQSLVVEKLWSHYPDGRTQTPSAFDLLAQAQSVTLYVGERGNPPCANGTYEFPQHLCNKETAQVWNVTWERVQWEPFDLDASDNSYACERVRLLGVKYQPVARVAGHTTP